MAITKTVGMEHCASARLLDSSISTKHSVEICSSLRYKKTGYAKKYLEEVVALKRAVPFKRYTKDLAHQKGMSAGRYPQKAAAEILALIKAVEANAQAKGLNTADLKIIKFVANQASKRFTGGRHRHGSRSTHVEVVVREMAPAAKKAKEAKKEAVKTEAKVEEKVVAEKAKTTSAAAPAKSAPAEKVTKEVAVAKEETKTVAKAVPAKEVSSEELLKQAQAKAADMKKHEQQKKEVNDVSGLYNELQQKGTLRKN